MTTKQNTNAITIDATNLQSLADAVAAVTTPVVEVHISNIFAREEFRKLSHVSGKAKGVISGLGLKGYELALQWFITTNP